MVLYTWTSDRESVPLVLVLVFAVVVVVVLLSCSVCYEMILYYCSEHACHLYIILSLLLFLLYYCARLLPINNAIHYNILCVRYVHMRLPVRAAALWSSGQLFSDAERTYTIMRVNAKTGYRRLAWWSMERTAQTKRTSDSDRVFLLSGPESGKSTHRGVRSPAPGHKTTTVMASLILESLCWTRFGCDRRRAHAIISLYCICIHIIIMWKQSWRQFHVCTYTYSKYIYMSVCSLYICISACGEDGSRRN